MPSSEAILGSLTMIANEWRMLAIVWHMALGASVVALIERENDIVEIRHILCPIDFSEPTRHALEHAVAVAKWYPA
jgi:hypothetical protein